MTVVVTGGTGFIGAHTCRAMAAAGLGPIRVLDDFSTGAAADLADVDGVEVMPGSILDAEPLRSCLSGADSVLHLAALRSVPRSLDEPQRTHDVNATGTLRVLEAARAANVRHVVVTSSSTVYGSNSEMPQNEELPAQPVSPYAASKLAAEGYAMAYAAAFGLDILILRPFNVYGPGQPASGGYAMAVPAFVAAALDQRPLPVDGDGHQSRDFTYVDTVAKVFTEAVARRVSHPRPVNVGFGHRCSLLEVIALLEQIVGRPLDIDWRPARAGDMRDTQADPTRLRSLFPGIEPVEMEQGLRATVDWARAIRRPG